MQKMIAVNGNETPKYGLDCEAASALERVVTHIDGIRYVISDKPRQIACVKEFSAKKATDFGELVKAHFAHKGHKEVLGIIRSVMRETKTCVADASVRQLFGQSKNSDWLLSLNGHHRAEKERAGKLLRDFLQKGDATAVGTFMGELIGNCALIRNKMD